MEDLQLHAEDALFGTHIPVNGRLIPVERICKFCGKELKDGKSCAYISLTSDQKTENYILFSRTSYKLIKFGIPRCEECKEEHIIAQVLAWLFVVISMIVVGFFSIKFLSASDWSTSLIIGCIFLLIIGCISLYYPYIKLMHRIQKIQSPSDVMHTYKLWQELSQKGWSEGQIR